MPKLIVPQEARLAAQARDGLSRWGLLLPFLGVSVLQAILLSITFPISELLSERPILYIDSAYHWYQMAMARAIAEGGALVGYDPYFAAGDIGGVIPRQSTKLALGLAMILPGLSITVLYKLYVFVGAVLAPGL